MDSDTKAINELKMISIDMINRAKSGYPGVCLDMAPVMYTLFAKIINVRPSDPNYFNRDRVILSSSHITPLYYATLHMAGYAITKEDLMNYRRLKSITPGLPEVQTTPGVDASTSFAGDGIGIAVGLALGRRYINELIKNEDNRLKILTYTTFCFCSEADLMSGSAIEAFNFACAQKLENLIFLVDFNKVGADGDNIYLNIDSLLKQYQAMGFYTDTLKDSTNVREITKSINKAKSSKKPAIIIFNNVIGADSFYAGKNILHSGPLTYDDTETIRKKFNSFLAPFEVSKDSLINLQSQITDRTTKIYNKWLEQYNRAKGLNTYNLNLLLNLLETGQTSIPFDSANYKINDGYREPLIDSNSKVMDLFASKSPLFVGGSSGLFLTTRTILNGGEFMSDNRPLARNIEFGACERGMSHVLNGLGLLGLRVFASTKLCYSDECKSGIRMSALMNLPITYIFTHDSVYNCEDGPARIPIEQIVSLRAIPNLTVYRPADINEVLGTWESILNNAKPAALIISKNNIPKLPGSNSKEVAKGAYIIKREQTRLDGIIIATGSEVVSAMQIAYDLAASGIDIRVVSMPSVELFKYNGESYEHEIIPLEAKRIVIEAGSSYGLSMYATDNNYVISISDFAYSGVTLEVLQQMNFDYDSLKLKVESLLR